MFLPTTLKEVRARGWDQLDVILFTGDAYIDHPSFGAAVVGRLLEAEGYRVAIVPQPNWRDDLRDFTKLGTPRLFFGVTAGAMDSMVNHYTANIRLRSNDAYTPGGKAGFRPDYAVKTYTQILKRLFPRTPVVIGGIEASLRRLTHYDYWSDSLHPSILADSGADLLIYGMGERVIQQVARAMNNGFNAKLLRNIRQVGFMADRSYVERLDPTRTIRLHSYEECVADKRAFGKNFTRIETLSNLMEPDETLVEGVGDRYAVITPPNATLTTEELDHSFDLPYERAPHRYRSLQNTQRLVLDFQRPGPELESLSGRASRRPDPLVSRTAVTTPILRCAAGHRGRPYRFSNRHSVSRSEFAPGNFRFRLPHPQIWVFMRNGFRQKNRFFAHLLMCSL